MIKIYEFQPQQKGKQGTKGAKQIVEENKSTLVFYRNMSLGSAAASLLVNFVFFEIGKVTVVSVSVGRCLQRYSVIDVFYFPQIMSILSLITLGAAYQFMAFMSKPKYTEAGALLDSGNDLNMEGGIAE